jgi:hypothetical protein
MSTFGLGYKIWSIAFETPDPEIQIEDIANLIEEECKKAFEAGRIQYKDSLTYIYESYEEYKNNIE